MATRLKTSKLTKDQQFLYDRRGGNRYKAMPCKTCGRIVERVDIRAIKIMCAVCVCYLVPLKKKNTIKKPRGWHLRKLFVDIEGTVYHKGKEQENLKGTLEPTEFDITATAKTKRRTRKVIEDELLHEAMEKLKSKKSKKRKSKVNIK